MKKYFKFFSFLFVFVFLCQSSAFADSYNVKQNDTLWDISEKYLKDMEDILWANPLIDDPDLIYPGEVIRIPNHNAKDLANNISGSLLNGNRNDLYNVTFAILQAMRPENGNSDYEHEIINIINAERERKGRVALKVAQDISNLGVNRKDDFNTPFTALRDNGILYLNIANVDALNNKSAKDVAKAWLKSDVYRIKILSDEYNSVAVGYVPAEVLTTIRKNINTDTLNTPAHDTNMYHQNPNPSTTPNHNAVPPHHNRHSAPGTTPATGTTPGNAPATGTTPGNTPATGTTPGNTPTTGATPGNTPTTGATPGNTTTPATTPGNTTTPAASPAKGTIPTGGTTPSPSTTPGTTVPSTR